MIWVIFSLLDLGLSGTSVKRTGCSSNSGATLGSDRNFGSVRDSADFGRFGSAKILPNFCRNFCHSISCSLTIYGYKADILCNSLQQIVFSVWVTAKFHNTFLDNSVLRCKTFCGEGFYILALSSIHISSTTQFDFLEGGNGGFIIEYV